MDKEIRKLKCRCCRWYYDKIMTMARAKSSGIMIWRNLL